MSLNIKKLKVDNFISIGSASFDFHNGIYLVKGRNVDKEATQSSPTPVNISNGAGKTTLFSAVYQGLFNKNSKDPKAALSDVNNSYTGKPYTISITLERDGATYDITNDRVKSRITILKNGVDVTPKGTTTQLAYIKGVVGFDFATFSSLTFLNADSLQNIIDLTNKDNIVYQFFDIESINNMEKSIKKRRKALSMTQTVIASKLSVLEKQLDVLSLKEDINLPLLEKKLQEAEANLKEFNTTAIVTKLPALQLEVSNSTQLLTDARKKLSKLKAEGVSIQDKLTKLSQGTCPTCKQSFSGSVAELEVEVETLRERYRAQADEVSTLSGALTTLEIEYTEAKRVSDSERVKLQSLVSKVTLEVEVAKDRLTQQALLKQSLSTLEQERKDLSEELPNIDVDIKAHDALIELFKSGAIVNEYLRKYRLLLVNTFNELKKFTSFDIDIKIRVNKGKMVYTFIDDGQEKSFSMLSAGERTRVSLMLLLATLKTIEQLTNTTVNYLVLDELLGVLDGEGITFLKNVLSTMRKDKSIFIITHHDEIEDSFADATVHVTKENNITRIH